MTTNLAAARFVTRHATDAADARHLLDLLGLLDGNRIVADSADRIRKATRPLDKPNVRVTPVSPYMDRPKVSTAPIGLRVLPPLPKEPVKRTKPTAPRATQKACGSETAAKRHRRLGEVDAEGRLLCQVCLDGRTARNGNLNREFRPCGTPAAYQRHLKADGRVTCQPCRDAHSAASAQRRAARRAAKAARA